MPVTRICCARRSTARWASERHDPLSLEPDLASHSGAEPDDVRRQPVRRGVPLVRHEKELPT